jgi:hypothetical protein
MSEVVYFYGYHHSTSASREFLMTNIQKTHYLDIDPQPVLSPQGARHRYFGMTPEAYAMPHITLSI